MFSFHSLTLVTVVSVNVWTGWNGDFNTQKTHGYQCVTQSVCVIILEYKFREDTNGQTLKDTDGKRRNSVASCLQRHSRCVHVNSCRMWITSETELKQQSDADLLFFYNFIQKWPVYVWTGSDRSDLWSIWTDIRVKKLQMDLFWEWRVNIVSLASHDDLNLDIKQQQQEPNLHNWTLIKGHLCWFLLLFLRLS